MTASVLGEQPVLAFPPPGQDRPQVGWDPSGQWPGQDSGTDVWRADSLTCPEAHRAPGRDRRHGTAACRLGPESVSCLTTPLPALVVLAASFISTVRPEPCSASMDPQIFKAWGGESLSLPGRPWLTTLPAARPRSMEGPALVVGSGTSRGQQGSQQPCALAWEVAWLLADTGKIDIVPQGFTGHLHAWRGACLLHVARAHVYRSRLCSGHVTVSACLI